MQKYLQKTALHSCVDGTVNNLISRLHLFHFIWSRNEMQKKTKKTEEYL